MRTAALATVLTLYSVLPAPGGDEPRPRPETNSAIQIVERYCGRDISTWEAADKRRPLEDALAKLCPDRANKNYYEPPTPAYVWKFGPRKKTPGYLVLERTWMPCIPGTTTIRLTQMDIGGNVRSEATFDTGGRCHMIDAKMSVVAGIEFPVLAIRAQPLRVDERYRSYYALIDGRFDLIREENKKGRAVRNDYLRGNASVGPNPPVQSEDQWEADLTTGDRAHQLRALVWLAGSPDPEPTTEQVQNGMLAPKVRARPAVAARLRSLAEHGKKWEREAAELALKPDDYR